MNKKQQINYINYIHLYVIQPLTKYNEDNFYTKMANILWKHPNVGTKKITVFLNQTYSHCAIKYVERYKMFQKQIVTHTVV